MPSEKNLIELFSTIPDPRLDRKKKHKLIDMIVITICAVISSCDNWVDIEEFGKTKKKWFKKFLELSNGIPSHDTFRRVFCILDATIFQKIFCEWIQNTVQITKGEVIAIDGKYLKGSRQEAGNAQSIIELVSACATEQGVG